MFNATNQRVFKKENENLIVTAAQNNTTLHCAAFSALESYAEKVGAELLVLPIRYNKKAFSPQTESEEENYNPEVMPYMLYNPVKTENAHIYAGCHILPTAKYPSNAAIDLNQGERFTIVASPKMQQKEIPRGGGQTFSTVYSTGVVTLPNYLPSRAGSVAEKSHKIGALHIIEGKVYPLEFDEMLHWDYKFQSIVLGDIHAESIDLNCFSKTLDCIKYHNIENVVLHDLLDFKNRNGHERQNGNHLFLERRGTVEDNLGTVDDILSELQAHTKNIYVVRSNHDDMLDRWLTDMTYNPHLDPVNAGLYHRLQYLKYKYMVKYDEVPNMLELALKDLYPEKYTSSIKFLSLADSLKLHGVECGLHGHKGVNGARSGLQKLNTKMITGHTHTGQRLDNFVTVGTISKLKQGYNVGGGSTWTHHNALICQSGRVVLQEI